MKHLYTFLFEACLSKGDYEKIKYIKPVVDVLCNNNSIRLGVKGEETFEINQEMNLYFQTEFGKVKDINSMSLIDFNIIVSRYNLKWQSIFKGDFSGYVRGLSSKNKGSAFEDDFIKNFGEYIPQLSEVTGIPQSKFQILSQDNIISVGGKNTKRPLNINPSGPGITLGDKQPQMIGDDVVDVKINLSRNKHLNLSLKCEKKVTFCNAGISKLLPKKSFEEFKLTKDLVLSAEGNKLLNFFGIDKNRFARVFINYKNSGKKTKSIKDEVDVTKCARTPEFMYFLKTVIGCGYILVHKIKNQTHMYDLRTDDDLVKFIGNVQSMKVLYPSDGNKKAVDVLLETDGISILFNFRSKNGKIYPQQLMADYTIKDH